MAQLQFRRDTAANWTLYNPTLADGEVGYETDTGKFKVGRAGTSWNDLTYYYAPGYTRYLNVTTALTTVTSSTWVLPADLQQVGMNWRVTVVGGGGGGGATAATAGQVGNGGGSGGVVQGVFTYVPGVSSMSFTVGAAGAAATTGGTSIVTYYGSTLTARGGGPGNGIVNDGGGPGGPSTGTTVIFNLTGHKGDSGGTMASGVIFRGGGADTPLGFGLGGIVPSASGVGLAGTGYGSGGSGGNNKGTATARTGGAGIQGIIIIEY